MDYGRIVKRAFQITWRYRALWVFGIILAIASGAGNSGGGGGGSGAQAQVGTGLGVPAQTEAILITALIGLVCLILALTVITAIARYVAETALIRMVDEYEETDQKHTVGKGFRLGWSRSAWRLFLIDLVVVLPLVVAFILLFVIALAPLLLWLTEDQTLGTIGTVTTIGLVVLVILLIIVVATAISVLLHFIRRACVLESLGTIDAIKHGVAMVRRRFKNAFVTWLLMVGIGLAWGLVIALLGFALVLLGVVLGGLPVLLGGGVAHWLMYDSPLPWIVGGAIGLPIFILVVAFPLLFLGGLAQVFTSSVWTLAYREMRAVEQIGSQPEPELPFDLDVEQTSSLGEPEPPSDPDAALQE